jgi:hypothetical protein
MPFQGDSCLNSNPLVLTADQLKTLFRIHLALPGNCIDRKKWQTRVGTKNLPEIYISPNEKTI